MTRFGVLMDGGEGADIASITRELEMRREWPADIDRQVHEIAEAYLDQLLTGGSPDRETTLSAHPDIAGPLGRCLALVELLLTARRQR